MVQDFIFARSLERVGGFPPFKKLDMIKKSILLAFLSVLSVSLGAQEFNFGIRAGLNYSKFQGPTISVEGAEERYAFSNGFHFGITWDYNFTDIIALKTELLYIQKGSEHVYNGDAYYKIDVPGFDDKLVEFGQAEMTLDISNAYLSFPLMLSSKVGRKWEVFGGVYGNILLQPTGRGIYKFTSNDRPTEILFDQSLDFNYRGDQAGEGRTVRRPIGILVDGQQVFFPKIAGAYFQYEPEERKNSLINAFDAGLSFGANYFMNRGFYFGMRGTYGLLDITDNTTDRSLRDINEDGSLIITDDNDTQFGLQFSFGFRF